MLEMLLCLLPRQPYVLCSKGCFFPLLSEKGKKKSYLETYLERNNLAFLKADISLYLIKSHSPKNVKSKSTNFLINPFIYVSGIALWLYFVGSRCPVSFLYLLPHTEAHTIVIHIVHQKEQQPFPYCRIAVTQPYLRMDFLYSNDYIY